MTSLGPGDAERFRALYAAHFKRILGYALRRSATPEDAADAVAETFLVAWRRIDEVPPGDEARLWIYGVARRVLANQHRSLGRRDRLGERLRDQLARQVVVRDPDSEGAATGSALSAMDRLGPLDREVLRLTAWEQLEPREIAVVLGLDPQVVRTRLSRARARLRRMLGSCHDPDGPGHVSSVRPVLVPKEER
jgi:RNA polymerase sigma-70 factor (ECF subfamily)